MYKAHVGDVSTVLRVALTMRTNTPDMYEIMKILGKERIEKRFEKQLVNLSKKIKKSQKILGFFIF